MLPFAASGAGSELAWGRFLAHIVPMDPHTVVHFECQNCGLPYLAARERRHEQYSGTVNCVKSAEKVAYDWTGYYNLFDWKPVRMEGTASGGY